MLISYDFANCTQEKPLHNHKKIHQKESRVRDLCFSILISHSSINYVPFDSGKSMEMILMYNFLDFPFNLFKYDDKVIYKLFLSFDMWEIDDCVTQFLLMKCSHTGTIK